MRVTRVRGQAQSDAAAFYAANWHDLVGLLTVMGGSRADAEELAQEAFIRLLANWERVRQYDDPGGWVRLVAVRLLVSRRRRSNTKPLAAVREPASSSGPSSFGVDLQRALDQLPQKHRAVVLLHYAYDMPLDAIADGLKVPIGTVKSQLARARANLGPLLADYRHDIEL